MRTVGCVLGAAMVLVTAATHAAAQVCPDVTGCWAGDYTGGSSGTLRITLQQTGSALSGEQRLNDVTFGVLTGPVSGTIECDAVSFESPLFVSSGQVTGDCMAGTWSSALVGTGTWQACRVTCACGNGLVQPGEGCDDGNTVAGDGCADTCTPEAGFICTGEPSVCVPIVCGNGVREPGEQCDDGNTASGDCCGPDCTFDPAGTECTPPEPVPGTCDGNGNCVAIPTLSQWGVAVLSVLMLAALVRRRPPDVAAGGR